MSGRAMPVNKLIGMISTIMKIKFDPSNVLASGRLLRGTGITAALRAGRDCSLPAPDRLHTAWRREPVLAMPIGCERFAPVRHM